jgi:hypothetical protein
MAQGIADEKGLAIGIGDVVSGRETSAFAREFYRAGGNGCEVDEALRRAKNFVNLTSPDFDVKLFHRISDGHNAPSRSEV